MARAKPATHRVIAPFGLNLRTEPSKGAEIVRVLADGESVTERKAQAPDGWLAVEGGYVMRDYVK